MAIPDPPTWNPTFNDLTPANIPQLPVTAWMTNFWVSGINNDAMQWLVAQGWEVSGEPTYDTTTTPPTPYYAMSREGVAAGAVLQSLINLYTNEYNTGRTVNDLRYEEIVSNWSQMVSAMTTHVGNMADVSNEFAGVWLGKLDEAVSEFENETAIGRTELQTYADDLWDKVDGLTTHFSSLATYYSEAATNLATLITTQSNALTDYTTDHEAKLAEIEAELASVITEIDTALTNETNALATYLSDHANVVGDIVADMTGQESAAGAIEADSQTNLDTHVSAFQAQLDKLTEDYTSHLGTIDTLLSSVSSSFTDHETAILAVLTSILDDYTSHESAISSLLTSYDSKFSSHQTDYNNILDLLLSDWNDHSNLARGLLEGLGATETVRINEKFTASRAAQIQDLMDRGMYSSGEIADITARNTRDENEELAALEDRLNVRKVENEHRLYDQLTGVRLRSLEGKDRLYRLNQATTEFRANSLVRSYGQLQDVRNRTIAGRDSLQKIEQDVLRYQVTVRESLASRLQGIRERTMAGLQAIQQLRDAMSRWLMDNRHRLYSEQLNVRTHQVDQATKSHAARMATYQAEIAARQSLLQVFGATQSQLAVAISRQHESEQAVHRTEVSERDALLGRAMASTQAIISGKAQANQLRQSNGDFLTSGKHRLAAMVLDQKVKALVMKSGRNAEDIELMRYQADASNNLMVGLWTFQERRNDMYPSLDLIAQLVSQIGDRSATSWVSP